MTYVLLMHPPNRIRELRMGRGLSQAALGAMVGLTQGQIGHLENGARNLTLEWMRRIARALDVPVADLLVDADNPGRLDPAEREVVAAMRQADPAARAHIRAMAAAVAVTSAEPERGQRAA